MKKSKAKPKRPIKLRKRTEELLNKNPAVIKKIPPMDVRNLLEDLQIYQIELEKYNNELQKAHEDLRESEEKYRLLVETMSDGLGIQDKNGLITYVNDKFCKMLNYKSDEFVGRPVTYFLDERNKQILKEQIDKRRNYEVKSYELEWTGRDGNQIPTIMSPQAIFDEKGDFKGSFAVITDISDRKQAEESLRKQTHDLNERVKELNCLYGISKIREKPDIAFEEMLQEIVELIPPSWQYPKITCVRIIIEGQEYKTKNFKETVWKQTSNIVVHGKRIGILEICYLEEKPESDEGPFQKEERSLISAITERLGRTTEHKQAQEALRESEEKYRMIFTNSTDGIIVADPETKKFIYVNPAICKTLDYTEEELTQMGVVDIHPKNSLEHVVSEFEAQARGEKLLVMNIPFLKKDGTIIYMDTNASIVKMGEKHRIMGIFRDVTERKQAEEELRKAHNELEHRVKERTRELEIKKNSLEEINTAMKVLLKKREEDKTELEDNILTNVIELVVPYFEKIKKTKLDDQQEAFLSIIESNLNEIISPFTRKMSLKYLNLTPTEIQIANLIRHGSPTKKIAELMNISPRTVETHRKNIRRKIGLKAKRANLRSHLLSLH